MSRGSLGWRTCGATGSCVRTRSIVARKSAPLNGDAPVSSSYRIAPQGVHVRRRADRLRPARLLGRHVAGRAENGTGVRVRVRAELLGDAEVRDLGGSVGGEENVGRFEIAVDDPGGVGVGDRLRERDEQPGGTFGVPGGAVEPQPRGCRRVRRTRTTGTRGRPPRLPRRARRCAGARASPWFRFRTGIGLARRRGELAGQDQFDRDDAVGRQLPCPEHAAHAAGTDRFVRIIVTGNGRSGGRCAR